MKMDLAIEVKSFIGDGICDFINCSDEFEYNKSIEINL